MQNNKKEMSSRSEILARIQQVSPTGAVHPGAYPALSINPALYISQFQEALALVGAKTILAQSNTLDEILATEYPGKFVFHSDKVLENGLALSDVDVLLLDGQLGVAENGAIWLTEAHVPHRVAPFICQHLVISINASQLVGNMHEAYSVLGENASGFGLFLAGPSKTADIEQSLVIGAHGARSLLVIIR